MQSSLLATLLLLLLLAITSAKNTRKHDRVLKESSNVEKKTSHAKIHLDRKHNHETHHEQKHEKLSHADTEHKHENHAKNKKKHRTEETTKNPDDFTTRPAPVYDEYVDYEEDYEQDYQQDYSQYMQDNRDYYVEPEIESGPEYDVIVVGGGTAGCVLARRLSDAGLHVLLLEAGGEEPGLADVPSASAFTPILGLVWEHRTTSQSSACLASYDHTCALPSGRVLGGSTVIGSMIFTHGSRQDFDTWRDLGNPGWGYDDLLPYFKQLENVKDPSLRRSILRGKDGPVGISISTYRKPISASFLRGSKELGYELVDYNGRGHVGCGRIQLTMVNGTRVSANRAYLAKARSRNNLDVLTGAMVTRVLIDHDTKRATGVEFLRGRRQLHATARREVVLSAGALATPQLLMLSGIGPAEHLSELGIPLIQNLSVGENLQDHVTFLGLNFVLKHEEGESSWWNDVVDFSRDVVDFVVNGEGALTSASGIEATCFVSVNDTSPRPDLELTLVTENLLTTPIGRVVAAMDRETVDVIFKPLRKRRTFSILPTVLLTRSRGTVRLSSRNPLEMPRIDPGYLEDEADVEVMLAGIKLALQLARTEALGKLGARLHRSAVPACRGLTEDTYWRCAIAHLSTPMSHVVGTARMGPDSDPDAVLDATLRVRGVAGLRVVDASAIPMLPAAHPAATVLVLAERAAEIILADTSHETHSLEYQPQ